MAVSNQNKTAYGLSQSILGVFNEPIISQRDPATSDKAPLGTVWVNKSTGTAFIVTQVVANMATWTSVGGGGGGVFSSLTVNPGDITVTAGDINVTVGDITAGGIITAGNGLIATSGGITSSGTTSLQGGTVSIATDNSANAVDIGLGTMARNIEIGSSAAAHIVTIGSTTGAAGTLIQGGTAGIELNDSDNDVTVDANIQTAASPTATITIDSRVGQAIFTGFTTANATAQVFTINNATVSANSVVLVTVANTGSNDAQMTLYRVLLGVNSMDITTFNNGAAALNGDVCINFWVLD